MAGSVGTIRIGMAVNTGGMKKGLGDARNSLGGFQGAVTKVGLSISRANEGIVTSFAKIGLGIQGITTLVKGVTSALTAPLTLAAEAEQTAVAMEVMAGSAETAGKLVSDLKSMGAATPYETKSLIENSKTLLSFGRTADTVMSELSMLSEVAQGDANKLNSLSLVFGQIASNGKLTGGDLMQLINVGFNPLNQIAEKTGESMTALRDRMSKGQVSFEEVKGAVQSATSAGGQFFQMNEKQSQTTLGLWSTLQSNLGETFQAIGEGLIDAFHFKSALSNVINFTLSAKESMKGWMASFKSIVDAVKPIFVQYFNTLMASWNTFSSVVSNVFQNISGAVSGFLPSWESFRDTILTGLIAAEFAWTNWQTVVSIALKSTLASILGFAGQVQHTFTTVIPTFVLWLADNWRAILSEMGRVGQLVFGNFANNVVNVISHIPDLIRGKVSFSNIWTPLTDEMALQFSNLPDIPERVMGEMETTLRKDVASMQSELSSGFQEFKADRMAQLLPQQELQSVGMTAGETVAKGMSESIKQVETGEVKLASTATFGSEAARSSILRHQLNVPDGDKELRDLNREQVSLLREQLKETRRQRQAENQTVTL